MRVRRDVQRRGGEGKATRNSQKQKLEYIHLSLNEQSISQGCQMPVSQPDSNRISHSMKNTEWVDGGVDWSGVGTEDRLLEDRMTEISQNQHNLTIFCS